MAKNTKRYEDESKILFAASEKAIPTKIKMGRSYEVKRKEIQLSLFDNLPDEKIEQYSIRIGKDEERKLGVTLTSVKRIDFALRELLYILSYQNKNTAENTGLAKHGKLTDGQEIDGEEIEGKKYYPAQIMFSLSDITKRAFQTNSFTNRKLAEATLDAMQVGLIWDMGGGKEQRRSLLWIKGVDTDNNTGSKLYNVVLHPIYAKDVSKNFALFKAGVLSEIGTITDAKIELLSLLGLQDKRKPFVVNTYTLLEKVGLLEVFRHDKKRGLNQLKKAIDGMVEGAVITDYPEETKDYRGNIIQYTFHLKQISEK